MVQPSTLPPLVRGEPFPMTWEEFLAWSPDEGQSEWVDGEGIAYVSNSERHVGVLMFLSELIVRYVRLLDLGRVFVDSMLVRLPTRPSGRMPDVFVVGRADLDRVRHQWVEGPPLLAAEVISEESAARDLIEKRAEYEQAGITEYLIVEARPGRSGLTFLRLGPDRRYQDVEPDADGRYHSESLPGFWLDPRWFDQDPQPNIDRLMIRIAPTAYRQYIDRIFAESPE